MLIDARSAPAGRGGIKFGHLLGKLVNRPLLTTPRRALTLFGMLAPRAGIRADDVVAHADADGGPVLLSALVAEATSRPRVLGPKDDGKAFRIQGGIAIIPMVGDLVSDLGTLDSWCGMTGYDGIMAKLDMALDDPAVLGAALYVNSPGGEVTQCAVCADRIREFQMHKPLRTFYADAGYSAACWTGSQGERVYAPRTGGTGSVGVITLHADLSAAYDEAGIKVTVLHAGAHKADGHPFAPLPKEVAAEIVAELEGLRLHFADAVALGRDIDVKAVLDTEARCLSADESLSLGFIDEILNPDDALAQFIEDLAPGKSSTTPAAQPAAQSKGTIMAVKAKAGPSAKSEKIKAKARPKASEAAEDEEPDGDEAPEDDTEDDGDTEDSAAAPEGDDTEDGDEEEDSDDSEDEGKASAKRATARIQAILTSPEAKASPALAQRLAFKSAMSAKAAVATLKAAATDAQSGAKSGSSNAFAAAMSTHSGPKLGSGGTRDRSAKSDLSSSLDRAMAQANLPKPQ